VIAIQLDRVSKKYRAGRFAHDRRSGGVQRRIACGVDPPRCTAPPRGKIDATINALREVSFEVPCGAGVGVIGRNGAGKTTLLKLISRVTWPTSGAVRVGGHVVSLIEPWRRISSRAHGREKVYLGAACSA